MRCVTFPARSWQTSANLRLAGLFRWHRQTSQQCDETLHQAMDPSEYLLLFAPNWDCAAHCSAVPLSTNCSCHVGHGGNAYLACKKTCLTCAGCGLGSKTRFHRPGQVNRKVETEVEQELPTASQQFVFFLHMSWTPKWSIWPRQSPNTTYVAFPGRAFESCSSRHELMSKSSGNYIILQLWIGETRSQN